MLGQHSVLAKGFINVTKSVSLRDLIQTVNYDILLQISLKSRYLSDFTKVCCYFHQGYQSEQGSACVEIQKLLMLNKAGF